MLKVLDNAAETEESLEGPTLDELAREGARRMRVTALAVAVAQDVDTHEDARDAAGLSATNIARLTAVWEDDNRQFRQRDLADRDYVYVWVDGIHFNIRLEDDRLGTLVMIGARPDGTKELVALEDGYRESTASWAEVLRDLQRRGLRAPVVAVGDGALGFWAAIRDVWPDTAEQRDWFHKLGNVLDKLPKRLQPKAKRALHDILTAETREQAEEQVAAPQRRSPAAVGPGRRRLHRRSAEGTEQQRGSEGGRLITWAADPQLLTISPTNWGHPPCHGGTQMILVVTTLYGDPRIELLRLATRR